MCATPCCLAGEKPLQLRRDGTVHELGVVFHMIDTLEEVGRENELTTIAKVNISLGEVTGVVPSYLLDCWDWAVNRTELLKGAELSITTIPAVTICNACGNTYETLKYGKTCPHCQSEDTELLRGLEMEIDSIEGC